MRKIIGYRTLALAGPLLAALGISAPAAAMPPVDYTLDGLGVDLKTGSFNLARQVLSIGPEGASEQMALTVAYNSQETRAGPFGKGWSHSYEIRAVREVVGSNTVVSVVAGMSTVKFTKSGSSYLPDRGNGDVLIGTPSGTLENFEYRSRDGDILIFKPSNGTACANPALACDYHVESWTKPDGERLVFSYPVTSGVTGRLAAVNSSLGWNMSFLYNSSNRMISAQAVNLAEDFCASLHGQPHCNLATWPKVTFAYTSGLQLASVTDRQGRKRQYGYDSSGRMIWTKRPSSTSNERTIVYNTTSGRVTSQTIAGAGTRTYAITGSQATVTNPLGQQDVVSFGTSSQPQWVRDGLARQTSFTYDSFGRLTKQTSPEGDFVQLTYDGRGNVTQTLRRARPGSGLADIVTTAGFPASCPLAESARCNKPLWVEDALGKRTDFTWDAATGAPLTVTLPADAAGIRARQRFGWQALFAFVKTSSGGVVQAATSVQRPIWTASCPASTTCSTSDEVKTAFGYGASGVANNRALATTTQDPGGLNITSTLTYDRSGNVLTADGPLAGTADTVSLRYDSERRLLGSIAPDPDGAGPLRHPATRIAYDIDGFAIASESGTVTGTSDAAWAAFAVLERLDMTYDTAGRPVKESLIASGITQAVRQVSYDAAGRPSCVAQRMNPAAFGAPPASACSLGTAGAFGPDRISQTFYDAAGQVTRVVSALGTPLAQDTASFTYTPNGQLATLRDARGNLTTMIYDGHGRLVEKRFPQASGGSFSSLSDVEEFAYDANGNVTQRITRDGRAISFAYDNLGRVIAKDLPGTAEDVLFGYDLLGRGISVRFAVAGSDILASYDKAGRPVSITAAGRTLSYQYDAASRRTRMTYPDPGLRRGRRLLRRP